MKERNLIAIGKKIGLLFSVIMLLMALLSFVYYLSHHFLAHLTYWVFSNWLLIRLVAAVCYLGITGYISGGYIARRLFMHDEGIVRTGVIWGAIMLISFLLFLPIYIIIHSFIAGNYGVASFEINLYFNSIKPYYLPLLAPTLLAGLFFSWQLKIQGSKNPKNS